MSSGAAAVVLSFDPDPGRSTTGLNLIALAISRSLGREGVPVVRVHPNPHEASLRSRYCRVVALCPDPTRSENAVVEFLLGLRRHGEPLVLFPAGDDVAAFLSRHRDALATVYRLPVPPQEVMDEIVDKRRQYERAVALGLPIPETYFPQSLDDVRELAASLERFPCVIKPLVSHRWRVPAVRRALGTGKGVGVATPAELVSAYERIAPLDRRVMVQEVIGGVDERLVTFLSYFDPGGEPRAWCVRRKIRQYPVDFGNCVLTETCLDPVVVDQSIRLLRGLGFHGISGVEWKHDPRTGRCVLIEINPRPVYTVAIGGACGVDLPAIAFRTETGVPQPVIDRYEVGVKWHWLTFDVRAAWQLHRRGELGPGEWLRSIRGRKVHAAFARDDWRPYASFLHGLGHAALGRRRWLTPAPAPSRS